MNRYATYLAGGALLATTALASGTVQAATVRNGSSLAGTATGSAAAFTTLFVGTTLFGSTATTVGTSLSFNILGTNTYAPNSTAVTINITGGQFVTGGTIGASSCQLVNGASSSCTDAASQGSTLLKFTDKLVLSPVSASWTELHIEAAVINQATSLATAGSSIALAGTVQNSALTSTFENITSRNIITSRATASFAFTANSTTASNTSTPAFANFGSATALTANVGAVAITAVTGLSTDLTANLSIASWVSTAEIRITHGSLSSAALDFVYIATATPTLIASKTAGQISSGVATFTLTHANISANTALEPYSINIKFNGTSAMSSSTSGNTVAITPTAHTANGAALASASGSLGSVSLGGLQAAVDVFQNSFNTVPSFLRITNNGTNEGTYTLTVRNSSTGATVGTYTGGTVPANASVQLSAANIETGASITAPTTFGSYTISLVATFNGYIQHLSYSTGTGLLSNLSAFRNGGGAGGQTAP